MLLDMRGPRIDERHILAGLHHMSAGITADRACSDDDNLAAHSVPPDKLFIIQLPLASSAFSRLFRKPGTSALLSALAVGGAPGEMLAAVDSDHAPVTLRAPAR